MREKALANSIYTAESWLLRFSVAEEYVISTEAWDTPADFWYPLKRISNWNSYSVGIVTPELANAGGQVHFEAESDGAAFDLLAQALLDQYPNDKESAWKVASVHREIEDADDGKVDITDGFFDRFNGLI